MPGRVALPAWLRLPVDQISLIALVAGLGIALALLPTRFAILLVGGGIVVLTGLVYPKLYLYLLIPAIPFGSLFQMNVGGVALGPVEMLLGLMLTTWLLKMMARQEIILPHPPLLWPFLLFLGAVGLAWLTAVSLKSSLIETIKWVEMLALYLFVCANFTRAEARWLIVALLLTGLAQAGLGLYQFIFKVGPEGFLLFGGRFLRAYGTFRQPNPYGGYLGLILPLALSLTLWGLTRLRSGLKLWPLTLELLLPAAALVAMLGGLLASQSRGALLGFGAAAIITILLKGGRWAAALSAGLIVAAILISMGALALLPPTLIERFADALPFVAVSDIARVRLTDANFAILERLAHWQAAELMWRDHLWLGVGFGNYEVVYPAYAVGRWLDPLGHAHNYLLNIGAETGLIGLSGYLCFWGWVFGFGLKALHQTESTSLNRAALAGLIGILVHLHSHNLLDNLYVQGMYLHVALILSLITLLTDGHTHYARQRKNVFNQQRSTAA